MPFRHLHHHIRFYLAALAGAIVYLVLPVSTGPMRLLAAGDSFFILYIAAMIAVTIRMTPADLKARATYEDEGILVVVMLALVLIGFCCLAVFTILKAKQGTTPMALGLALASAPLGWLMLHTLAAYHYASLYYARHRKGTPPHPLTFPETKEPGTWDFVYFAFVVGMTAQVSDVQVNSSKLRRATLGHSLVSFFFNTVLIAMAVNAAVAVAS